MLLGCSDKWQLTYWRLAQCELLTKNLITMTREKFIKKWLGNKDYQYTEQNRDLMRDDLDEVINQALRQPPVIKSVCDHKQVDLVRHACKCKKCGKVMETEW